MSKEQKQYLLVTREKILQIYRQNKGWYEKVKDKDVFWEVMSLFFGHI